MRKTRSDAVLLNLPEERQAQLCDWLLSGVPYHQARSLVQKEWGVTVSLNCFSEFWQEVCGPALIARRARAARTADAVAEEATRDPGRFDAATVDALKQRAFELAISPGAEPDQVKSLFTLVLKARDQDLQEREFCLARAKFEFDAAETCLAKLPELKAISEDNSLDEDAKLQRVRERLFGPAVGSAAHGAPAAGENGTKGTEGREAA